MTLETIAWRGTHVEVPDNDRGVLVFRPQNVDRVVVGCYERGYWFAFWGPERANDEPIAGVTHWAEMPTGAG